MTTPQHNSQPTASASSIDVDLVVREVLRRLTSDRPLGSPVASTSQSSSQLQPQAVGNITLSQRVITLDDVEGRLDGAETLTVPVGAVVTPAVRDALKQHKVALLHADGNATAAKATTAVVIATADTTFNAASLAKAIESSGTSVESVEPTSLTTAVSRLSEAVAHDGLGVLLTDKPALAACVANRDGRIRAAVVHSLADVTAVIDTLGANLLIVEPLSTGMFALRSMITTFVRTSRGTCPAELINPTSTTRGCGCSSAK